MKEKIEDKITKDEELNLRFDRHKFDEKFKKAKEEYEKNNQ